MKPRETGLACGVQRILNPHRTGATIPDLKFPDHHDSTRFDALSLEVNPRIWVRSEKLVS